MIPGQFHIIEQAETDSSNNYARGLLERSRPEEMSVVRALYQTGGRGQAGNHWESAAGENLTFSIILYPIFIKADRQFCLSMAVSLGICDYLSKHVSGVTIKWPNDIYVNDEKIAGILIENSLMQDKISGCIAGIGINMNQVQFAEYAPAAVSLSKVTGKKYVLSEELQSLLKCIAERYDSLRTKQLKKIQTDYLSKLYRYYTKHLFEDPNGCFSGIITGIGDSGELLITADDGSKRSYLFKEVRFL